MTPRQVLLALAMVLVAVVLQTTLFKEVRPFRVAPDLVLVVAVASIMYLDPVPALLLGFTGGLLMDLQGSTPLGLRALVLTLVAYAAVRSRDRFEGNLLATAVGVLLLSVLSVILFTLIGTLFGQSTLEGPDVFRRILLVPVYNFLLAFAIVPITRRVLTKRATSGVTL